VTVIENIWVLTSILIIVFILGSDPKSPANNIGTQQVAGFFSSTSESQQFIKRINWFLIIIFFVLSLVLSIYF
jgi:protein translocase SecG subunit